MHHSLRGIAAVALLIVASCSAPSGSATGPDDMAATSSSHALSTTLPVARTDRTFGVGRVDITLVDRTRNNLAERENDRTERAGRTLDTVILYPTADRNDDASGDDHPVADGQFPLLVFAHGASATGPGYAQVLDDVAAAGFVVALPTFPLTSGPQGWDHLTDVVNQPADMSFIIDELLARSVAPDNLLSGHLAPDKVAVGGHSLGAVTALYFTNSCCIDPSVHAVVAISGTLLPAKGITDFYHQPAIDLGVELLHGMKDDKVPYGAGSRMIFETFTELPRALVSFPDAGHLGILASPSIVPAIVAFLNLELRHDSTGWTALRGTLQTNGDARIEVAGGLPRPG